MSRKGRIITAVALLAAAAVAFLVIRNRTALLETAELVEQGGERRLREPLRTPTGGSRVLLIALDGVGDAVLRRVLAEGRMPQLQALLGGAVGDGTFRNGYAVPGVLSILPSTTMAAWSSVYTGEPPARTGVPGNEWFVREEMRFYAPAPVSVTEPDHTLKMYTDGLVGNAIRVPTLFERAGVRAYVSLAPVYRGADILTTPDPGAVADLFREVAKGVTRDAPVEREVYSEIDLEAVESLIETARRHGPAELQVAYFPGVDLFTHGAPDPLRQQMDYLHDVVDPALGRIFAEYARAGVLDSTYVVVVADHGHTPVLDDDRHALGAEGDDEPTAVLSRAGFRLRPLELDPEEEDYQAAVAYQGAMAYVYLADRSTCPRVGERCDWRRPPRLREDVLPVVRAFHAASRRGAGVPALRGTLDLVFARMPAGNGGPGVLHVFDGAALVPLAAYLRQNPRPDLIDLERRMNGLAVGPHGDRAGDVILLARSGGELPIQERFYFSGLYHSWHGSPHATDSRVPLIVGRRGTPGSAIRARVAEVVDGSPTQLDVTPLVLHLLGRGESPRR